MRYFKFSSFLCVLLLVCSGCPLLVETKSQPVNDEEKTPTIEDDNSVANENDNSVVEDDDTNKKLEEDQICLSEQKCAGIDAAECSKANDAYKQAEQACIDNKCTDAITKKLDEACFNATCKPLLADFSSKLDLVCKDQCVEEEVCYDSKDCAIPQKYMDANLCSIEIAKAALQCEKDYNAAGELAVQECKEFTENLLLEGDKSCEINAGQTVCGQDVDNIVAPILPIFQCSISYGNLYAVADEPACKICQDNLNVAKEACAKTQEDEKTCMAPADAIFSACAAIPCKQTIIGQVENVQCKPCKEVTDSILEDKDPVACAACGTAYDAAVAVCSANFKADPKFDLFGCKTAAESAKVSCGAVDGVCNKVVVGQTTSLQCE